jgi:uncharacterized protein involved in response to NO
MAQGNTGAVARFFSDGWRVFFTAAALYAVFSLIVWTGWLGIHAFGGMVSDLPFAPPPHLWHAHEMVFGYPAAAMGGFFLTAVPNWTGTPAARRGFVIAVAALWLAGRLGIWVSGSLPVPLVAGLDLAFLPVLGAKILAQLLKRPKPQNMMFLAVLALIWAGNLMVHLDWAGVSGSGAEGLRLGLYATCGLIVMLGGRVTPAFTRNAMTREGIEHRLPRSRAALDAATIALTLLTALAAGLALPAPVLGALAIGAGAAQLGRGAFWRPLWTWRQPILWALHLSMALLGLGLILAGLSALGLGSEVAALHLLGIGAVGGMTLAVMSRAALGHGGHALVAPGPVAVAYGLLAASAVARWAGSSLDIGFYYPGVLGSGALWILAFTLAAAALWPVLTGPRATSAPGD